MNKFRNPLTAVCAALALWTLAVFALTLSGLGARFSPYPDDPGRAPELPNVQLVKGGIRLGPITDYLEVGQRPLLTPDRRPGAVADSGEEDSAPLDASLTSVLISGDVKLAILQDNTGGGNRRVRLGELLEGTSWRLQSLEPRRAVLVGPLGEKTLDLRVFDGRGGASPTPLSSSPGSGQVSRPAGSAPPKKTDAIEPAPGVEAPTPDKAEPAPQDSPDQQAQVEAIRRRIEARRAQMRADAAKKAEQKVD